MQEIQPFKWEVQEEMLPKNERSEQILAARQAANEARLLKEEQVSWHTQGRSNSLWGDSEGASDASRYAV